MGNQEKELRERKYPRVKESCQVTYRVIEEGIAQAEERGAMAVNISGGGMCFSADRQLQPGSLVALEMSLSQLPTPVLSLGRVAWCEVGAGGKFDVGVEFWWIGWADEEAQRHMLGYIGQKLKEMGQDKTGG